MINLIPFILLLCFPLIYCFNNGFVGIFLTEDMKILLKEKYFHSHNRSSPFYGNTLNIYCEHSTIEFNPGLNNINKYKQYYGHIEKLKILAYAEDEHVQTILVHSVNNNNDSHHSMNEYPHVTISVSNIKPYTPVYSNDLWKRFIDEKIIEIKVDEFNKPQSIIIKDQINEWNGKLNRNEKYEETQAYIKIINQNIYLDGIFCFNHFWKNNKCQNI